MQTGWGILQTGKICLLYLLQNILLTCWQFCLQAAYFPVIKSITNSINLFITYCVFSRIIPHLTQICLQTEDFLKIRPGIFLKISSNQFNCVFIRLIPHKIHICLQVGDNWQTGKNCIFLSAAEKRQLPYRQAVLSADSKLM